MKYTLWISRRLRLGGAQGGSSKVGVVIAVTGVALALIIMEFTIAIVLGFKHEIQRKLVGFDAQVTVMPPYNYSTSKCEGFITLTDSLEAVVHEQLPRAELALTMRQPGMLKTDDNFSGVYFLGRSNGKDYSFEKENIVDGQWPDYSDEDNVNKIVISRSTANALKLAVDGKVYACFFINDAIKSRRYVVAGIYESNFGEYDKTVAYASLAAMQSVADADDNQASSLDIWRVSDDPEVIVATADTLQDALLAAFQQNKLQDVHPVTNVTATGAIYFNWLSLLNTNVVVIFILMICVAGFTLVSSLFIIILERIRTIGILRSLGASKKAVRQIFINMALRLVGRGMLIGNALGIILLLIQQQTGIIALDPQMYYLKAVPVELSALYFVLLNVGVAFVAWLILIVPSHFASSVDPSNAMRYE
jgi:lipoprotein-releasing system permease protein